MLNGQCGHEECRICGLDRIMVHPSSHAPEYVRCPNPIARVPLMGGMVQCELHVLRHYHGAATLAEASVMESRRRYQGYGEDEGDDVRRNLAEWVG